jgi:hypothetical protein
MYPSTPLWIDALCIDQSNTRERNHQVQLMGRIYAQATCVIAWLGIDAKTNDFLIEMPQHKDYHNISVDLRMSFLDNDYWRRAWIIQEIVLARQVFLITNKASLKYEKVPKYLGRLGSRLPE